MNREKNLNFEITSRTTLTSSLLLFVILWIGFLSTLKLISSYYSNYYVCHIVGWSIWFLWHTVIFDNLGKFIFKRMQSNAYKTLFFLQIVPIVTLFGFLISFPLSIAISLRTKISFFNIQQLIALVIFIIGALIIFISFKIISVPRAAFSSDYSKSPKALVKKSVYSKIRHPLYAGSLLISFALSLAFPVNFLLFFGINLLFSPVYIYLEERRLINIYGQDYIDYIKETGAIIPKFDIKMRLTSGIDKIKKKR